LGLSGVYGGYSSVSYKPEGFNQYLSNIKYDYLTGYSQDGDSPQFGSAAGFRIGANVFRAKFKTFFLTTKVFYQFLKENGTVRGNALEGTIEDEYKLNLNHFGVGLDFGMPVYSVFDIKILEAGIVVMRTELENTIKINNDVFFEDKYDRSSNDLNYYVGSGFIIHAIRDYISVEGTASYNIYGVSGMEDDIGRRLTDSSTGEAVDNFMEKGGFTYTVQINIGIPI
jgi:hypothetical protein